MKIAIDCRMLRMSGIGSYLSGILHYLVSKNCYDYVLLGNKEDLSSFAVYSNCFIVDVDIPIFSIKELFSFPVYIVNHCNCFYSPNYNIPLGIKVPIFATIHDVVFLDVPRMSSPIGKLFRLLYLKRSFKISQLIFTVSDFSKERIKYHLGNNNNVIVTYNGISDRFNYFDIPNKKWSDYFLFIGNVKYHKGLKTLLEAFHLFKHNKNNYKLLIVGEYENFKTQDSYVRNIISHQTGAENIFFTGKVDDKKLKQLISQAIALIQPSLYEGFGIPPLESMFLGTPVILSDIPVFRELYSDFPVTFFHVEDSHDLYEKMYSVSPKRICLTKRQKERFSYKKSAEIILNNIDTNLKK